jgi:hypothetical protein
MNFGRNCDKMKVVRSLYRTSGPSRFSWASINLVSLGQQKPLTCRFVTRPDVSTWQNFPTTANMSSDCVAAGLEGLGASSEGRAKGSLLTKHVQVVHIREGAGRGEPTGAFSKIIGVNRYGDLCVRAICALHHRPPYDAPHAHPLRRHCTGYLRPQEAQLDEKICGPAVLRPVMT